MTGHAMTGPRLLDLFCGAGGAAMGYHRAGFEKIVGVDNKPQPHYPFEFILTDALEYVAEHGHEFDAIHASPPCQRYSRATAWRGDRTSHPDLIGPTQELLKISGKPYVIENVQEARHLLSAPFMLCGTMSLAGLNIQSHRYFEVNFPIVFYGPAFCQHSILNVSRDHGKKYPESTFRDALDCHWMTVHEAREAIPPAYTEFIGKQLLAFLASPSTSPPSPRPNKY